MTRTASAGLLGLFAFSALLAAPALAADGAALFQEKCSMCHGATGHGDGPAAAGFTPRPKDFADPAFWAATMTQQKIENTIRNGHVDMPPMDQNPAQVKALAEYLISTFKPK